MKKILIIDESSFSRICSAILENEGHRTEILEDVESQLHGLDHNEFGLIIISYPFGYFLFDKIKKMNIPTIILTDHINRALISLLYGFNNSYCMVKPLDYQKFRTLINQIVCCEVPTAEGFNVL